MSEADASPSEETGERDESRVGRRQLLRAGANLGAASALVFGFGAEYVSTDALGTITYALARPNPDSDSELSPGRLQSRTKEVPVAWHERLRLAFSVHERIRDAGISPLVESFVVPGSYDEPDASIVASVTDDGARETIRALVDDVSIDLDVVDSVPSRPEHGGHESPDPYQVSELESGDVPGGVACESPEGLGTLAPALFDAERERRGPLFATSNHVYGAAGTRDIEHRGDPLSVVHDDQQRRIGEVIRGYPAADIVTVSPVDEYRPMPEIERATPSRVVGQYTKAGLADLAARDEPLTKLGAMTDETSGQIQGIDGVTCYTGEICKSGQLKWGDEEALTDGDSGSVNFHEDELNPGDYVLVGGMNNARTWWPGADFAWGTAGHYLLEEHGLHF